MTEFNSDSTETHRGGAPPTPVRGPVIHQPPADPEPVISLPARPLPRVEETGSNHLRRLNVGVGTLLLLVFGAAFAVGVSGTVQRDDIRVLGTSQTAPTTSTALNGEIAAGSPGADGSVIGAGDDDDSATPSSSQIAALPVATAPGPPTSPVTAPAGTSSVATSQEATTAPTRAAPTTAPETTAAAPTTTVATTVRPTTTVATTDRPTTTTTTTTQPTTTTTTEPTTTSTTSTTTTQPTTTTTTEPTTTTTSSTTTADDGPGNGGGNGRGNNGNGKGNGGPRP